MQTQGQARHVMGRVVREFACGRNAVSSGFGADIWIFTVFIVVIIQDTSARIGHIVRAPLRPRRRRTHAVRTQVERLHCLVSSLHTDDASAIVLNCASLSGSRI